MKKKKVNIVLDTNIFINPECRFFFGKTPEEALNNFLDRLFETAGVNCYMPPSIYEELMKFINIKNISSRFLQIDKKPPAKYELSVPAIFLYEFIEEMRDRINKGLRIAEKHSRKQARDSSDQELIKALRNEYRVALREGIIDSKEDFDLVLLAKELDAWLATSDNGLIKWAHKLGITCLSGEELKTVLETHSKVNPKP